MSLRTDHPVGTVLRGTDERGVTNTIRILAVTQQYIIASCDEHGGFESSWNLTDREWEVLEAPMSALDAAAERVLARLFPLARPNEGQTAWESTPEDTKQTLRAVASSHLQALGML